MFQPKEMVIVRGDTYVSYDLDISEYTHLMKYMLFH